VLELVTDAKQRLDFIFLYFQLPYLPEETCLMQAGPSAAERPTQAVLGFPRRSPAQVVLGFSRRAEGTSQPVTISKK
jgi:hypothetical protein